MFKCYLMGHCLYSLILDIVYVYMPYIGHCVCVYALYWTLCMCICPILDIIYVYMPFIRHCVFICFMLDIVYVYIHYIGHGVCVYALYWTLSHAYTHRRD